jgi:hypothetical protein
MPSPSLSLRPCSCAIFGSYPRISHTYAPDSYGIQYLAPIPLSLKPTPLIAAVCLAPNVISTPLLPVVCLAGTSPKCLNYSVCTDLSYKLGLKITRRHILNIRPSPPLPQPSPPPSDCGKGVGKGGRGKPFFFLRFEILIFSRQKQAKHLLQRKFIHTNFQYQHSTNT